MEEKYYFKEFQKMLDGVQTLIEKDKTILQNKKFIRFMKKFGYEYDGSKVYFVFDNQKINKMKKQIRVYDIKWFYNYKDHMDNQTKEEYDKTFNAEPTEIIIDTTDWNEKHLQEDWIEDSISDYISDESGYYHEGYSYEWVKEETIKGFK